MAIQNINETPYIGTSVQYPLNVGSGSARIVSGREAIDGSIAQLLGIYYGTLPMSPYFGSKLNRCLFIQEDSLAISLCRTFIKEALLQEGRILVLDIIGSINQDVLGRIDFSITYRILASNEVFTFVYPFYRNINF
jgi:phage baseplate assembly protein W